MLSSILSWREELSEYILILTTIPNRETGQRIAKSLVQERLAACVTISGAAESHYTWKGELIADPEFVLFIKTKAALFQELKEAMLELHPYEVPEIIALPVLEGHRDYLDWIDKETKS